MLTLADAAMTPDFLRAIQQLTDQVNDPEAHRASASKAFNNNTAQRDCKPTKKMLSTAWAEVNLMLQGPQSTHAGRQTRPSTIAVKKTFRLIPTLGWISSSPNPPGVSHWFEYIPRQENNPD